MKPTAPSSASSAISVSSSPAIPRVIVARKPTGTRACSRARWRSERSTGALSTTGSVFGMARIAQKPPAAAARVPESMSSSSSRPGVRRCTCGSTKAGKAWSPAASTTSAPCGRAERAGLPHLGDLAVAQQQVALAVEPGARVEQACPAQEHVARGGVGAIEPHAHAGWGSVSIPAGEGAPAAARPGPPASSS